MPAATSAVDFEEEALGANWAEAEAGAPVSAAAVVLFCAFRFNDV